MSGSPPSASPLVPLLRRLVAAPCYRLRNAVRRTPPSRRPQLLTLGRHPARMPRTGATPSSDPAVYPSREATRLACSREARRGEVVFGSLKPVPVYSFSHCTWYYSFTLHESSQAWTNPPQETTSTGRHKQFFLNIPIISIVSSESIAIEQRAIHLWFTTEEICSTWIL